MVFSIKRHWIDNAHRIYSNLYIKYEIKKINKENGILLDICIIKTIAFVQYQQVYGEDDDDENVDVLVQTKWENKLKK